MPAPEPRLKNRDARQRAMDDARFFAGWLRRPLVMGAVSPSSRTLGRVMAGSVPAEVVSREGMAVLELGPGTGVVTQCLLDRGIPEENLVLVEYSGEFCTLLEARFPKATVIEGDAFALGVRIGQAVGSRRIGAVVSSLPLFTKPDAVREALIGGALGRMPTGHPFIQFSYAWTVPVKPQRVAASLDFSPWVRRNLPPARVLVYRRGALAPTSPGRREGGAA